MIIQGEQTYFIVLGSWKRAGDADRSAIISSLSLCSIRVFNQTTGLSSEDINSVLNRSQTLNKTIEFLNCDKENRAHSLEWLAYAAIQMGDWTNTVQRLQNAFISYQNHQNDRHYLYFVYRIRARTIVDLFFWYPYKTEFFNRTNQLLNISILPMNLSVSDNETRWYPMWSEAGLRFSTNQQKNLDH